MDETLLSALDELMEAKRLLAAYPISRNAAYFSGRVDDAQRAFEAALNAHIDSRIRAALSYGETAVEVYQPMA